MAIPSTDPTNAPASAVPVVAAEKKYAYWEPYKSSSETFRNWLIAYGIAIPYLFVSEKGFGEYARQVPILSFVVVLFFAGVIAQLIQLGLSKYTMMLLYTGEESPEFKNSWIYRKADALTDSFWPYIATDVITLACYAAGTLLLFCALIAL